MITRPGNRYIPWRELLRRTFGREIVCPDCGGKLWLIALVKTGTTIRTLLAAVGIPTGPPEIASPRSPPQEVDLEWNGELGQLIHREAAKAATISSLGQGANGENEGPANHPARHFNSRADPRMAYASPSLWARKVLKESTTLHQKSLRLDETEVFLFP